MNGSCTSNDLTAQGEWSLGPPCYLRGIDERGFNRMRSEWLSRVMSMPLLPSYRVVAYILCDLLNWATMDCWASHGFVAEFAKFGEKTIQRGIFKLEHSLLLSIFRIRGSRYPLRYAPVYLPDRNADVGVSTTGHHGPGRADAQDHQSFLDTPDKSSLNPGRARRGNETTKSAALSFDKTDRINIEFQVADLIGGYDELLSLAFIDDDIISRLCEAFQRKELGYRQIKATRLAVNQLGRRWRMDPPQEWGRGV